MSREWYVLCATLTIAVGLTYAGDPTSFPDHFLFGAASASYQVEGAWNESGKGENIWDRLTHEHPDWIVDRSTGNVACDSYHRYKEDVSALSELGVDMYRFSISWSRILPKGDDSVINQAGIEYYNNLITELLNHEIQPMVTMYHWDLPQPLQDLGGWTNPVLANYFMDYVDVLFRNFGDRVKWWLTFNEPLDVCSGYSYARSAAPGIDAHGVGDYLAAHTILQAHAQAFHLYNRRYRATQKGKVGITLDSSWLEPHSNSSVDIEAAERGMQFQLGWFAHPIFSKTGDYPPIMRKIVDRNSMREKRARSRLPVFSQSWVEYIKGSTDYFGLNHYTTRLAAAGTAGPIPSIEYDTGVVQSQDPHWPSSASPWLKVVPWGFRKQLQWIKKNYYNPPVFITENGFPDHGKLNDVERISYYTTYLTQLLKAIHEDGCNVIGYTAWSIIDNFEWLSGYTEKFGLYYVNFSDPARPRIAKDSARVLAQIIRNKRLPPEISNEV